MLTMTLPAIGRDETFGTDGAIPEGDESFATESAARWKHDV